jgi:hypothetical protein
LAALPCTPRRSMSTAAPIAPTLRPALPWAQLQLPRRRRPTIGPLRPALHAELLIIRFPD